MDTSKEYIEMCRKAVEIQYYWKNTPHIISEWARSYFVSSKDNSLIHYYDFSQYPQHSGDYTFLPRQDQSIAMLPNDGYKLQWNDGFDFMICVDIDNDEWTYLHADTAEQALLGGVMHEKFNKKWDGKDWI